MQCTDHKKIKGIVLAGVHPWDRFSLDGLMPRCLVPIGQWPLISYVLAWFQDAGINDVTICANSTSRMVEKRLGGGAQLGMSLDYYEDQIPRGPAGCIYDVGLRTDADLFVVADATTIPRFRGSCLLDAHVADEAAMTVALFREPSEPVAAEPWLVPTGMYVLGRSVVRQIRPTGYQDIKEVLIPRLHESGQRVGGYLIDGPLLRVHDTRSYLAVNELMVREIIEESESLPDYTRNGGGCVHRTARTGSGLNLIGPVLIGPESQIEHDVTIVGPSVIGAGCRIGTGAVITRSVAWNGVVIGEGCRIDGSLLTAGVRVEANRSLTGTVYRAIENQRLRIFKRLAATLSRLSGCRPGCRETPLSNKEFHDPTPLRAPRVTARRAVGAVSS